MSKILTLYRYTPACNCLPWWCWKKSTENLPMVPSCLWKITIFLFWYFFWNSLFLLLEWFNYLINCIYIMFWSYIRLFFMIIYCFIVLFEYFLLLKSPITSTIESWMEFYLEIFLQWDRQENKQRAKLKED